MKRVVSLMMVIMLLVSSNIIINAEGERYTEYADKLKIIGVFQGTNKGFELDREPTRLEGLIMLLRLLGKEEEAQEVEGEDSFFSDVPSWGVPYTNYAVANKLTDGIGDGKFGTSNLIKAKSYITFMLRALGYDDSQGDFEWDTAVEFALEKKIIDENMYFQLSSNKFLRDHVAKLSYEVLYAKMKDSDESLLEHLISIGSIDSELALELSFTTDESEDTVQTNNEVEAVELAKLAESCVYIEVDYGNGSGATGSGFYTSSDGRIVTNYHVIEGAQTISVLDDDGTWYQGEVKILGYDKTEDIAIIKTNVTGKTPVKLGNSANVKFGEKIYAIGSPVGLKNTVSEGLVSAIRDGELQISAAISHGSSGGALFNESGEVIGITYAGIESGENLGFAIPINKLANVPISDGISVVEFYNQSNGIVQPNLAVWNEGSNTYLSWSDAGADYYYVYMSTNSDSDYNGVYDSDYSYVYYYDEYYSLYFDWLTSDNVYYFKVVGVKNGQEQVYSTAISIVGPNSAELQATQYYTIDEIDTYIATNYSDLMLNAKWLESYSVYTSENDEGDLYIHYYVDRTGASNYYDIYDISPDYLESDLNYYAKIFAELFGRDSMILITYIDSYYDYPDAFYSNELYSNVIEYNGLTDLWDIFFPFVAYAYDPVTESTWCMYWYGYRN